MAELLKGAPVAHALNERIAKQTGELKAQGIVPTLAILRVGERTADISYEKGAVKRCQAVGVEVKTVALPEDTGSAAFFDCLNALNEDADVHGILMLRPLPKQIDEEKARCAIHPAKDVDGCSNASLAGVFTDMKVGFAPCTAQAVMEILDHYGIACAGKKTVVIGRSLVIGRPVAMLLMHRNATVTICHTKTENMAEIVKAADIVVVCTGKMESIGVEYFGKRQIVVDVGIGWNDEKGKLCGDVRFDEVEPVVSAITPVPGGVGAVTTGVLAAHVVDSAKSIANHCKV